MINENDIHIDGLKDAEDDEMRQQHVVQVHVVLKVVTRRKTL